MEKERMNEQEMEKASGGWDGEYKYIGDYSCPSCGTVNPINRYCTSGQSTWTCRECGTNFTVRF